MITGETTINSFSQSQTIRVTMRFWNVVTCCFLVFSWVVSAHAAKIKPQPSSCQFAEDPNRCKEKLDSFVANLPKANKGDYLAQREVAFCYATGCGGAIFIDPIKACVWQTVIVSTSKSDNTDAFNFRYQCEALKPVDRSAAKDEAAVLFIKIYKKPAAKALPYEPSNKQ